MKSKLPELHGVPTNIAKLKSETKQAGVIIKK